MSSTYSQVARCSIAIAAAAITAGSALADERAECREKADVLVSGIPNVAFDRLSQFSVFYRWHGLELAVRCNYGPEVDSFALAWNDTAMALFADYRAAVSTLINRHTGETSRDVGPLLDRCLRRAKTVVGNFQAVGKRATLGCSVMGGSTLISAFVRSRDDVEH